MNVWVKIGAVVAMAAAYFLTETAETVALMAWLSLGLGFMSLTYAVYNGIEARRRRQGKPDADPVAVELHQDYLNYMTTLILIGVVGIEIAVRKSGGMWGNPWFVAFHLSLVAGMVSTYGFARFKFTGLADRTRHQVLVYSFIVFYLASFITGSMLINEKFHFS